MPGKRSPAREVGRLVASVDFERVLATRSRASTAHFSFHHVEGRPTRPAGASDQPEASKLSTICERSDAQPVEDFSPAAPPAGPSWVGAVVPKRHARRAVTRSLIKRQIYAVTARGSEPLAAGLWIVRLRAPFQRAEFTSAASPALRRAVRSELETALAAAVQSAAAPSAKSR